MSFSHWIIEGVGINVNKIEPYLNRDKLLDLLVEQCGEMLFPSQMDEVLSLARVRSNTGECLEINVEDYLDGHPFENLADLLTFCDDTDTITCGDDGEGNCYFYYPPSMPWMLREDDPKTIEEVCQRIVAAVQKITDLSKAEIEGMIDECLYVVGQG